MTRERAIYVAGGVLDLMEADQEGFSDEQRGAIRTLVGNPENPRPAELVLGDGFPELDVFWRANGRDGRGNDGLVQLGVADPRQEYGNRPVDVILIHRTTAARLIGGLAKAILPKGEEI